MLTKKFSRLLFLVLFSTAAMAQSFDLQGHRGARGLVPENSIPAFKRALDLGVNTLELDVVISRDGLVVVSHDPYFSPDICLDPDGRQVPPKDAQKNNIYQFSYEQIRQFDCGSKGNARFPEQEKMPVYKPLLSEVFEQMELYRRENNLPEFSYNIEIKSSPAGDNVFHPAPDQFSDLVYQLIRQHISPERIILQSFDFRVLRYWHDNYPEVPLAALVENTKSAGQNLQDLGFTPQIYSPYYKLLSRKTLQQLQQQGIRVIPWTVNRPADMKRLKSWGVNGLITDYPDRAKSVL
jgi:glycerophosphoryl diester phosphodiesterase